MNQSGSNYIPKTQNSQGVPQPPPPFSCTFSPNIPELMQQMNISLAISTYQTGKVIFVSPKNRDELIQLPRNFPKPMGIAVRENQMAIALRDEVLFFSNSSGLAQGYPKQPNVYDAFYTPRHSYYTGDVDMHDVDWSEDGFLAVNTRFSCLSKLSDAFSFEPVWKPPFITELTANDKCHLNGMAMEGGKPRFVTALGESDSPGGWRESKANGGIIIDVESGEIVARGLSMPHSPKMYDGQLYVLQSGNGDLTHVDIETGKLENLREMSGFGRGMDRYGDYLFIGLSKLRTTSKAFQDLPISQRSVFAGVYIIYMPTMSSIGFIKYETSVEEIYDIKVIPNAIRPGLLNNIKPEHKLGVSFPGKDVWLPSREEQLPPKQ